MKDEATQTWKRKFYDPRQAALQRRAHDWSQLRTMLLRAVAGGVLLFLLWNAGTAARTLWAQDKGAVSVGASAVVAPVGAELPPSEAATEAAISAEAMVSKWSTMEHAGAAVYWLFTLALLVATGVAMRCMTRTRA